MTKLFPCPFCSCAALIGEVHERDDRRWMSVRVDCANCDAFQRASIPYNEFSKMSDAEISTRLFREASALWNKRDDLAMACVASYGKLPDPLAAAEGNLLGECLSILRSLATTDRDNVPGNRGIIIAQAIDDAETLLARATSKEEA